MSDKQEKSKLSWLKRPTMSEFLNRDKKYKEINFTGAGKCNLCSCSQYEGGDSPSSLCHRCGHERHKHEYRT